MLELVVVLARYAAPARAVPAGPARLTQINISHALVWIGAVSDQVVSSAAGSDSYQLQFRSRLGIESSISLLLL